MNILKKYLKKYRIKCMETAIKRCNAFSPGEPRNLCPPFFYLINEKKTIKEMERYGLHRISEVIKRTGQEEGIAPKMPKMM